MAKPRQAPVKPVAIENGMITKAYLTDRLAKLETEQREYLDAANRQMAAFDGAIHQLKLLLADLEPKPEATNGQTPTEG